MINKDIYFYIACSEDGVFIQPFRDSESLNHEIIDDIAGNRRITFIDEIKKFFSTSDWKEGDRLIIKGHIIVPTPVNVVTRYTFDENE